MTTGRILTTIVRGQITGGRGPAGAQQVVECDITDEGSYWLATPRPGHVFSLGGSSQIIVGTAPADSGSSVALVVAGLNDDPPDPRLVKLADGSTDVADGDVTQGSFVGIRYHPEGSDREGTFQLLWGALGAALGAAASHFVYLTPTEDSAGNNLVLEPTGPMPNNTGNGVIFATFMQEDQGEGGVTARIIGINDDDPLQLNDSDATTQLPAGAYNGGSLVFFTRPGEAQYAALAVWPTLGTASAVLTPYEKALASGAGERAATAERLARRTRTQLRLSVTGADLLSILASQTMSADTAFYNTGAGTMASYALTAAGRALLDDADAAAQRATLGLGTMALQAASGIAVTGGSAFGLSGLQITGSSSPTSGSGLEIQGGSTVVFQAYNRTGGAYISFNLDASNFNFRPSGSTRLSVSSLGAQVSGGSLKLASFTVAGLPSASTHGAGSMVYVSNESGGAVVAFSDGTNWRRVTDRAVVS